MMKKVLITGASGFIGRYCLPLLREKGFDIYAISSQKCSETCEGIHWIHCDLLQSKSFKELTSQISPTHLLHLAWNATPGKFWTSLDNLGWVKASIDLLEAFALHGGKRVVMAGTCAEYDWGASDFSEEKTPCHPDTLYGSCKAALHQILASFAKQVGISQAWGRIFYLYGPYEYPQRFVPAIIKGLLKKESIPCSHGNQIRDFLHVQDVADAFVSLLDSEVEGAINIASGKGISLREVIGKIANNLSGEDLIQFGKLAPPPNDPASLIANISRLEKELCWAPKISLDDGLKETIAWWQETLL